MAGTVAVANCFSFAVPSGNPINVLVLQGGAVGGFARNMLPAGLAATAIALAAVAILERRRLGGSYVPSARASRPWTLEERRAGELLLAAGVAALVAGRLGIGSWWGVTIVGLASMTTRGVVGLPWRLLLQVGVAYAVLRPLAHFVPVPANPILVALGCGLAASVVNNLPVAALFAALPAHTAASRAALVGLGAGALATPRGSVATVLAFDLTGTDVRLGRYLRRWTLVAMSATLAAAYVLR